MINDLYTPIKGSPHVVKVVNVLREFTKGEKMENTAITQQVLAQRQKFYNFGKETLNEDDLNFEPFSMALELFLEEYEKFVEVDPELFIRTNGKCEEDRLCGAEELKTIKAVLQDMELRKKNRQIKSANTTLARVTMQKEKYNLGIFGLNMSLTLGTRT